MTVYTRQIATAIRLIKAKGEKAVWKQNRNAAPPDVTKPWIEGAPLTPVSIPVSIVFLPTNKANEELIRALMNMPEVKSGSVYGLMASVAFAPSDKDTVVRLSGREVRIESIDVLEPDGTPILYTIYFKD